MSRIIEAIPVRRYEQVRDQIASIIAVELNAQCINDAQDDDTKAILEGTSVFTERIAAPIEDESFVVSVVYFGGNFENQHPAFKKGKNQYLILVYGRSAQTETSKGEALSAAKTTRLMGVIDYIFNHPEYIRLGFDPRNLTPAQRFITRSHITDIKRTEIREQEDATSVIMYQMTLDVEMGESTHQVTPVPLTEFSTLVKVEETELGYEYLVDTDPDPTPDPVTLTITYDPNPWVDPLSTDPGGVNTPSVSGGSGNIVTWELLPGGDFNGPSSPVTFDDNTGEFFVLPPAQTGTFTGTVRAVDDAGNEGTVVFTVEITTT